MRLRPAKSSTLRRRAVPSNVALASAALVAATLPSLDAVLGEPPPLLYRRAAAIRAAAPSLLRGSGAFSSLSGLESGTPGEPRAASSGLSGSSEPAAQTQRACRRERRTATCCKTPLERVAVKTKVMPSATVQLKCVRTNVTQFKVTRRGEKKKETRAQRELAILVPSVYVSLASALQ